MKKHTLLGVLEALEEETQQPDVIKANVPTFLRLMEFAKESAQDDMVLHRITERITELCQDGTIATMKYYDQLIGTENSNEE